MVVFQEELPEPPDGWDDDDEDFEVHVATLSGPPGSPPIHVIGKQEEAVMGMVKVVIEDILGGTVTSKTSKDMLN